MVGRQQPLITRTKYSGGQAIVSANLSASKLENEREPDDEKNKVWPIYKTYDNLKQGIPSGDRSSRQVEKMDERLRELSEGRYAQQEFLKALFDLALEEEWFELQHLIQHDMAKAILADYSYELGLGYLNQEIFYKNWEDVIEIGWRIFCEHTGLTREKVNLRLAQLREAI